MPKGGNNCHTITPFNELLYNVVLNKDMRTGEVGSSIRKTLDHFIMPQCN